MAIDFTVKLDRPVTGSDFLLELQRVANALLAFPVGIEVDPPDVELEPGGPPTRLTVPGEDAAVDVYLFEVPDIGVTDEPDESGWWAAFEVGIRTSLSLAIALSGAIAFARLTGSQVHDGWGIVCKGRPADPDTLLQALGTPIASDPIAAADALARGLGVAFG